MPPRLLRFGPEDEMGFRAVSLVLSDKETLRLSLNFGALREHLIKTATDNDRYPEAALSTLKMIAKGLVGNSPGTTLDEWLRFLQCEELTEASLAAVDAFFAELGMRAAEVALLDLCMMVALDSMAQSYKAPQVTTAIFVKKSMSEFTAAAAALLNKRGPRRGKRNAARLRRYSKAEIREAIPKIIRKLQNSGAVNRLGRPSEAVVAGHVGLKGQKALYRFRRDDGDKRDWPAVVDDALSRRT